MKGKRLKFCTGSSGKLNYRLPGKGQEEEILYKGAQKNSGGDDRIIVCVNFGLDYIVVCLVKCVQSEQILIYVRYISITVENMN